MNVVKNYIPQISCHKAKITILTKQDNKATDAIGDNNVSGIYSKNYANKIQETKLYPVNKERLASLFMDIVKIPGPSRNERKVADFLKQEIAKLGYEVAEDDAGRSVRGNTGNLLFTISGNVKGAKPIILISHMDTVSLASGVEPVREGDIIKPKGRTALGGDNRAGVSDIIEAIKIIQEEKIPHGDIQVIFSVAEEAGLLGSMKLDPSQLKGKIGFAVDSFKANEIYTTPQGEPLATDKDRCVEAEKAFKRPMKDNETEGLGQKDKEILELLKQAIRDVGLEPQFRKISGAASDAWSLRDKGIPSLTIGAGEENIHRTTELVRLSELERCTQVILALISRIAGNTSKSL